MSDTCSVTIVSFSGDICRICHCEEEADSPLLSPCSCAGSLNFVHQACLQHWIKSADVTSCELCRQDYIMYTRTKPFYKWKWMNMQPQETKRLALSLLSNVIILSGMIFSLAVFTTKLLNEMWQMNERMKINIAMVTLTLLGGSLFFYLQARVYSGVWRRWRAYNRVVVVCNRPDKVPVEPEDQTVSVSGGLQAAQPLLQPLSASLERPKPAVGTADAKCGTDELPLCVAGDEAAGVAGRRVASVGTDMVESATIDRIEPVMADIIESVRADEIEPVIADKIEFVRTDEVEPVTADKIEYVTTDGIKSANSDHTESMKVFKTEPVLTEKTKLIVTDKSESVKTDE